MLVSGGIPRGWSLSQTLRSKEERARAGECIYEGMWPGGKPPGLGSRPSLPLLYLEPYLEGM